MLSGHKVDVGGGGLYIYIYMYMDTLSGHKVDVGGGGLHMWQSRVEIKHYSIAYFARIAAKRSSVELPLRAGLICTHQYLPRLHRMYKPHP